MAEEASVRTKDKILLAAVRLFNYFCFGTATLNVSPLKIGLRNWSACLYLLFQMIKAKNA